MDILSYLSKIPDVVWAAILASILTFGGVLLTNIGNNKRLLAQLRHDAEEKSRERQMSIRREVYLPAAEAISKAYYILMELPQANFQSDSWKADVNSISNALAKIHVVGSDETVNSATQFSAAFSKILLELTPNKIPLEQLKVNLNILSNLINMSSKERDRSVALMKEFNLKGLTDQRLWDTIQHNYDFESQQVSKYIQEQSELFKKYNDLLMELTINCYQRCIELGYLVVPALCAIRAEMDFPFNIELYRKLVEEKRAEMENSMLTFIEIIKSQSKAYLSITPEP